MTRVSYSPAPGSPEELARFADLEVRLRDMFESFSADPKQPYTAVVVPSQSVDPIELAKIPGVAHYEERSLFNLMLLRHPRLRVIYVTSKRLDPLVVDYFLHQMRNVPSEHARRRLTLFDCDDASARPLTEKLLERPRLLERVKAAIGDLGAAHLVVFNSTHLERTLSVQLGIPLNACDPDLIHLGSKTGARRVFQAAGVPLLPGREDLRDPQDLAEAIVDLRVEVPGTQRIVVKLNDSFSGEGNALLDLRELPVGASAARILEALPGLKFEAKAQTWEGYAEQFTAMRGICETWAEGEGKTSPSVQLRVNPLQEAQIVSTHDQVMGGPSGQVFMGATFPASDAVRVRMQGLGLDVGKVLAERGVIGRFAVDFLAVPDPEGRAPPALHALEINLRQGGTTHPFNTLKFLTDGRYDATTGTFKTRAGQPRCYFATDAISAPDYRGILPFDLLDRLVLEGIHFRSDETGVVFHLLGCLSEYGKLGCTSIAPTVEAACALHAETLRLLDTMSGRIAPD